MADAALILERLIGAHPAHGAALPPLTHEQPFSLWAWIGKQLAPAIQWVLQRFFGTRFDLVALPIGEILAWVVGVVLAVLVAWLAARISYPLLSKLLHPRTPVASAHRKQSSDGTELEEALRKGQYARAMRLRWRSFLQEQALALGDTPRDQGLEAAAVEVSYRAMFAEELVDRAAFESWDSILRQRVGNFQRGPHVKS